MTEKNCMIYRWSRRDDYWTNTNSPGFARDRQYRGCLETRRHGSSGLIVAKKKRHVAVAGPCIGATTTRQCGEYGTYPAGMPGYTWMWRFGASGARGAGQ